MPPSTPANPAPTLAPDLFGLADEIDRFMDERSEDLSHEDWEALTESATQLRTLANVFVVADQLAYTTIAMAEAHGLLRQLRENSR